MILHTYVYLYEFILYNKNYFEILFEEKNKLYNNLHIYTEFR